MSYGSHENLLFVYVHLTFFDLHTSFGCDCAGGGPKEVYNFWVNVQEHLNHNVKKNA